jgi:hypothetical protein
MQIQHHIRFAVVAVVANCGKFFPAHEAAKTGRRPPIQIRKREARSPFANFERQLVAVKKFRGLY